MLNTFSNTQLRVPKGFQSLLVGLATEILRKQPRNINLFAAEYFEKLLQQTDQEQTHSFDKATTPEKQYSNQQSFQDEFPIDSPDTNNAATKIQAQFRGHKARQDFKKLQQENKQSSGSDLEQPTTPNDEQQKSSFEKQESNDDLNEEEKREQERAAVAIQAQFRGFQVRKNLRGTFDDKNEQHQQKIDKNSDETPVSSSIDSDENFTTNDKIDAGENDDTDLLNFERQSTGLGEKLTKHTGDYSFDQEDQPEFLYNDDDMSDPALDKAATRIQASFRGYKTRKELGSSSVGNHSNTGDDQQHSSPIHDDYDNTHNKNILLPSAEGNKVPAGEDDDYAAAVKIQAAYRGYRVRKELEK